MKAKTLFIVVAPFVGGYLVSAAFYYDHGLWIVFDLVLGLVGLIMGYLNLKDLINAKV